MFKRIDTCAAEFASPTAYMYSTYETPFAGEVADESAPSARKKVVILGGGPNRIGQGIEFDYCCCHACFALRDVGYETIMINCNPETVSTDYDTADRLYFEPLTAEDVLEIIDTERSNGTLHGVIVQFGGQTPLKLAHALEEAKVPILGTSPEAIDLAEDRDRFKRVLDKLQLKQPKNGIAYSVEQARLIAGELGYPLVVRPSYVLGGRAMQIIREEGQLGDYLLGTLPELVPADVKARYPNDKTGQINTVLGKNPLLFDRYLSDAVEVDVDCLADGKDTFVVGIMEHIEEAGIHSGDSACSLPPHSLDAATIAELERQTRALALGLDVGGLMNVQYAIKDGDIYVLEVNPRASRTVPFVAKVIGKPVAKIAARIMAGESLASFQLTPHKLDAYRRQGIGVSVRALPRRRHGARAGDEIDRRGDGPRHVVCDRLREEPARRRHARAAQGHRVRLRARRGQARGSSTRCGCSPPPASRSSPPPARSAFSPTTACRPSRSTRCSRAVRTSSMRSPTAKCSSSSTPRKGRRRWPTAVRCGAPPSCIRCRTTPLFQERWRLRRGLKAISAAISRSEPCKAIFRPSARI